MIKIFYLDHKHQNKDENEHSVEVGNIEGGSQAANQGVAANNSRQQHSGRFRREIRHQTEIKIE